jgi:nucleoside-diphosphate-sugar epimerase
MKNGRLLPHVAGVVMRAVADMVLVQTAMIMALAGMALRLQDTPWESIETQLAALRSYYLHVFLPLSLLFPLVYAATGLYTRSRTYNLAYKLRRAATVAVASALGFIVASFLVAPEALPRTTAVIFSVLITVAIPGIRWLKHELFENETRRPELTAQFGQGAVLVVGGAGYIGSIVVRKLLKQGYQVRVLDNLVYGDSALREVLNHPRLEFINGDCRNIQDVVSAMAGVHSVVHLAAIVGDPACDRDHKTAREINYSATRMMIEIAKGEHVSRFIFASSCSVYGASDQIMDENSMTQPISLYAETKVDSEQALLAAATADFHPTILRFATIFGLSPRPRFDLVVNLLTAKAMQEGVVTIYNGQQWRPFLHVADAAESVVRVLDAPLEIVSGQIYNVGDQDLNYTLTDVAQEILKIFPGTRIEHIENSDRRNYRVSFEKIRRHLEFACSNSLEDGICELKAAFEDGLISDYLHPLYSNVKFLQVHGSPLQQNEVGAQVMAALSQKVRFEQPAA